MNELYELRFALMRHAVEMNLPHAGADTIAAVSVNRNGESIATRDGIG